VRDGVVLREPLEAGDQHGDGALEPELDSPPLLEGFEDA